MVNGFFPIFRPLDILLSKSIETFNSAAARFTRLLCRYDLVRSSSFFSISGVLVVRHHQPREQYPLQQQSLQRIPIPSDYINVPHLFYHAPTSKSRILHSTHQGLTQRKAVSTKQKI